MAQTKKDFLTRRQVAEEYPIKVSTLAHMASSGVGPSYMRVGKCCVYLRTEIEDWLLSRRIDLTERSYSTPRRRGRPRKSRTL